MASGWWKTPHTNLAAVSPVDFEVLSKPQAPRGYPKLASIATGAGLFLGGTPCITVNEAVYYAGDDYTQDTDNPVLVRYDGRISTIITEIPVKVSTPRKAILSLAADSNDRIFISTWDSGTTSADFTGSVFMLDGSDLIRIDGSLFTSGKLPIALVWFNNALYVGVTKQDPANTTEVIKLNIDTVISGGGPTNLTGTFTGTTYSYRILAQQTATPNGIGKTNQVSCLNSSSLSSSYYNTLTWEAHPSAVNYRVQRDAPDVAVIAQVTTTTFDDIGYAHGGMAGISSETENFVLTSVTPTPAQASTTKYRVGAVVGDYEYISDEITVSNTTATLTSGLYVALAWTGVTDATSYRVYRTLGHSSTGLIGTTTATFLNDTGLAGTGTTPTASSSIALSSGAVAAMAVFGSDLYVASYQPASTFGKVFKITTADALTTSTTAAPGGSAAAYNGYTALIVYNSNLYAGYWNDDATDVCLIEKFTGSAWSTVSTVSGAGARPWVAFCEADDVCYAYGGGDAKTGILYESPDGTTWTDSSALLPSAKEAIPFMANVNMLGGF